MAKFSFPRARVEPAVSTEKATSAPPSRAAAENVGGYLATITSAEENEFVYDLISDSRFWYVGLPGSEYSFGPWLGGYQYDNEDEPAGHGRWVTDEGWM